jgi:D-cysteine desulfhydrase
MENTAKIPISSLGRARPWLFEAFPALRQHLPWTPLVNAPTPVQPLERISARLGREIWIKRDDKTSPLYGGNKARKLEFILGEALALGQKTLITGGGLGTNHGLATAIFGKKLDFQVLLGLFDQPVTAHVRKNLLLFHANGAEIRYVGSLLNAVFRYYVIERLRRPGSYFIPPGGSSALGTLGYVDAGLELAMQVERKVLPLPRMIFLAAGTCSTAAGLILGLRLAGLAPRVIGVQVAPRPFANPKTVLRLARKALRKMKRHDQSVPQVNLGRSDAPIEQGHYGPGYGVPTDAGRAAVQFMAENEGIPLELTYTGKAFGALLASVKSESSRGPVLFWNTFNSVDLSSTADNVRFQSLPGVFHRFFQGDVVE